MKEKIINFILIMLIILFCISISPVTMQNDTYYAIAIGEHILENGIDMKDPFSWHEDLSYTYPHWAYDFATYLVYSAGQVIGGEIWGFGLIYLSTCILCALLGITLYKVNQKIVGNRIISFMLTLVSIYVLRGYIAARAQLVTFILFVLEIYFIEQFLKTPKKRYVLGLIIIPILLANLHVAVWWFYFILYFPYIAEFLMCKMLKKQEGIILTRIEIQENKNIKYLIAIMIICLLTGLLTPLGTVPYTYLFKTMMGNTTSNINEHLPMTIIQHAEVLSALAIFVFILVCTKVKLKLRDAFMLCGLIVLMFYSRRQLTIFVLVGSIILNKLLYDILQNYRKNGTEIVESILFNKIGIAMISLLIVIFSVYFVVQKKDHTFVDSSTYPVQASEWILENLDLNKIKLYNEYNYGSYLLYNDIPVFIDSRADLYAPEFNTKTGKVKDGKDIFMDFINTSNLNTFYQGTFEKYGITHVMLYKNAKVNSIICNTNDGTYKSIYEDDNFIIYEIVR